VIYLANNIVIALNQSSYATFELYTVHPRTGRTIPLDLSDAETINLNIVKYHDLEPPITYECEVVDAKKGICRTYLDTQVTKEAGDYLGEIEVITSRDTITFGYDTGYEILISVYSR